MAREVAFEEFDITRDSSALQDLVEVHRSRMTPTTVIGGRVIIGFDQQQLEDLLGSPP